MAASSSCTHPTIMNMEYNLEGGRGWREGGRGWMEGGREGGRGGRGGREGREEGTIKHENAKRLNMLTSHIPAPCSS